MSFLNQFKEKAQELHNSVQEKVEQAIQAEPLQGLHKNANALLQQGLQKMNIVFVFIHATYQIFLFIFFNFFE